MRYGEGDSPVEEADRGLTSQAGTGTIKSGLHMHLPATVLQLTPGRVKIDEPFTPVAGFRIAGVGGVFGLDETPVLKELADGGLNIGLVQAARGGSEAIEFVA